MTTREYMYHRRKKVLRFFAKPEIEPLDLSMSESLKGWVDLFSHSQEELDKWVNDNVGIPIERMGSNQRVCENEGCSHYATVKCELDYQDEITNEWKVQTEWLCCEHANEEGYCMGCGTFIAGTGMEFTNNGYCDNCWDEIKYNEIDEEEDFADGSLDY